MKMVRAIYSSSLGNTKFSAKLTLRAKNGLVSYNELVTILKSQGKPDKMIVDAIDELARDGLVEIFWKSNREANAEK